MSGDSGLRDLERQIDAAGDVGPSDTRHTLTRERLRRSVGICAWWPGSQSPHPSAARVILTFTTVGLGGVEHRESLGGWALAVGGIQDVFMLARAARACTFLDLATGDWIRTSARRSGYDVGTLQAREEVTTVDAFGRPRATVKATPRGIDLDRFSNGPGSLVGHVREESIYDQEWIPWDATRTRFFVNFSSFQHNGAPRFKQYGIDTNLSGGYCLPQGYAHEATGVTLELRDALGKPLKGDPLFQVSAGSSIQWLRTQTRYISWPLGAVVLEEPSDQPQAAPWARPEVVGESGAYVIEHPAPPVFPLAFPLNIQALESFSFDLERPLAAHHVSPTGVVGGGFFARVVISGFLAKAFAA